MFGKSKSPVSGDSGDKTILVNKLTVGDAVHILRSEGGGITAKRLVFRLSLIGIVAAFTARAILLGQATAWHLFLPMAGEYLVLLLSLPVINQIVNDKTLRQDTRRSIPWLVTLVLLPVFWIAWQAFDQGNPWPAQARMEWSNLIQWITTHEMHWPIIGASAGMLLSLPGRVAAFHRNGPPFVGVSIGCAMRLIIPLFGCFLAPLIAAGKIPVVWLIWVILLLAELAALTMQWDLQRRLVNRGIEV